MAEQEISGPTRRSRRRPNFYERFESDEACAASAYADGVEHLTDAVGEAGHGERGWANKLSVGLSAGLDFLAADPPLAQLLFVDSLAAARPARLEYDRSLERLAAALRPPAEAGEEMVSAETARMLAGGLASHISGRILAREAERLPDSHGSLLRYLLAPSLALRSTDERRAAAL
jgi:hypothetical protein